METLVLDKNKSIHKLNYLPPVYYINLDEQIDRRHHVEDHFKYWGITNYTRISAYDGRNDDLSDIIKGRYPEQMTSIMQQSYLSFMREKVSINLIMVQSQGQLQMI